MAEAKTCRPGLVARLRDRLLISASARHLAIDLVERHGAAAGDVAQEMLATGGLSPQQRRVLIRAEPTIAGLIDDSADKPLGACRAYRATVAPAPRGD